VNKKEHYKHTLPHFQQPGQAYFVTWCLKDSIPKKALKRYATELEILQSQIRVFGAGAAISNRRFGCGELHSPVLISAIENRATRNDSEIENLKKKYYTLRKKYIKAYDDLLDAELLPAVNLSKPENTKIILEALHFWEGKKLVNHAYSIMPNHVHWVFELLEKDENGKPVYLQDILQSVKRHTANQINKVEGRTGTLWQKESFDTTIRDDKHLYYATHYTLNNPVSAGLVKDWKDWPGSFGCSSSSHGCGDF
jgi:putative transposase